MPDKIFGLPAWAALLTLGAAGVVGYLIFFRNKGGSAASGGSTYSAQGLAVMQNPDESATMAAQNQLLSQLAINQQAGFQQVDTHVGQVGDSVNNGFSSVGTSLNSISGQVSGVSDQVGQLSAADASNYTALSNALGAMGSSLSAGQGGLAQQITNMQNTLQQSITSGQKLTTDQMDQLGSFLGWQFYQLPNRYTALIPAGVNPPGWH